MKQIKLPLFLQILSVGLLASTLVFSQAKPDGEMIFVRASVVDNKGKPVENLKPEQFAVKEDGVEQEIKYFSDRKESASVLIMLDVSGSADEFVRASNAENALNFIRSNPENDYSIVAFNTKITELADWGSSRRQLVDSVSKTMELKKTEGNTAFFDTLMYALGKFKNSKHEKKVILVLSDGQDNASKKGFSDAMKELRKSDVSVFSIAHFRAEAAPYIQVALAYLDEIGKVSGGKSFYPQTKAEVEPAMEQIEAIVNNQYVVGYVPKKPQKDKDWHKFEIRISAAGEKGKSLKGDVVARTGYFAGKP
jgi:Ca-activated chloride channel family protein